MAEEYEARVRRDGDMWIIELAGETRVQSFGRTIAGARARLADATALWFDRDSGEVEIVVVKVDGLTRAAYEAAAKAIAMRNALEDAQASSNRALANAVSVLADEVSLRDAAELLGVSHQRVHQLQAEGDQARAESEQKGREIRARLSASTRMFSESARRAAIKRL